MLLMTTSDLPLERIARGKVRDVYKVDADRLLLVATDRVSAYEADRLTAGAARSTVNYELAMLRKAFNLAVAARRVPLSAKPAISRAESPCLWWILSAGMPSRSAASRGNTEAWPCPVFCTLR